jgi:hypothetical protein
MNMTTKKDIFSSRLSQWLKASGNKKKRGLITRAVSLVTGMHPKSIPRSFRRAQLRDHAERENRGRPVVYGADVTAALSTVWKAGSEPCGENLHPLIAEYVEILIRDGDWNHSKAATHGLLAMSEGTVKARLAAFERSRYAAHGKGTTKPGSILSMIPVRADGWKYAPAGTLQIDTVAHCGHTVAGDFIYTVNATDAATMWGGRHAQWNKGRVVTVESMEAIEAGLPFPPVEWHPDSGSEFINWHCKEWCEKRGVKLTRSRPNHKNDNCFVEERNGHVVRAYVGYMRLDARETVAALNNLYAVLTPYLNHFVASKRIVKRERIGARWKISREKKALTPYQRVLARKDVSLKIKKKLIMEHKGLNPLRLRRKIDLLTMKVFNVQRRHGIT